MELQFKNMVEPSLFTGPKEKLLNTTEDKTFDRIIYLFKNTKIIFNIIFFNVYDAIYQKP